jgi:arsenate reductase (glutaredoxin)
MADLPVELTVPANVVSLEVMDGAEDDLVVYYNPSCSKCRTAVGVLKDEGVDHEIVECLKAHPTRQELERILDALSDPPTDLVRRDPTFGLSDADVQTRAQVVDVLLAHPELMQRPVIFRGERAVIARSPEKLRELLD